MMLMMRMMHMICSFLRHSKSLTHPQKMATCSNKRTTDTRKKMNNREMLIALYIHKGRKVIQPRSAEYSQSTKKKNPIQQAWR